MPSSKEKGDIAVGQAIAHYLHKGYEVLLPIGDKQKYDLVLDINAKFVKVQCKYTTHKNSAGNFQVPLRVMGGNQTFYSAKTYLEGDFDLLFVCTKDMILYEFPFEKIKHRKASLSLSSQYNEFRIING